MLAVARDAHEDLLADPGVDLVLTYGPLASAHARARREVPKPILAAFVVDTEEQARPSDGLPCSV